MLRLPQLDVPAFLALALLAGCASKPAADAYTPPSDTAQPNDAFAQRFTGRALRVDYAHLGTRTEEHVAVSGYRLEGAWPGSRTQLVDTTNTGKYRFRVFDTATGEELWSRGFCSIYGEWETSTDAKTMWQSFEESQRFPEPRAPVKLALEKRTDTGGFREIWRTELDPQGRFVDRSALAPRGEVISIVENGPAATKVDLLFVADGYTAAQRAKFVADATRNAHVLLETEPYKRHAQDFNVRALFVPVPESGVSNPRKGVWRASAFGLSFNAFDSDRYVLTFSDRTLREACAQAPYDALILLFNERKYGGGGIYNSWSTAASDSVFAPYLVVHEFGHAFAGLADEYYSSQVAYEEFTPAGSEPWEPNVTALTDPAHLKWKDLVETGTPLPTAWNQAAYDERDLAYQARRKQLIDQKASEDENEALMQEIGRTTRPLLAAEPYFGRVGAFQGAMYEAKALYRPEVDCIMFTRNPKTFCKVCERAIERTIERYVK